MKKLLLGIALSAALMLTISPIANATEMICGTATVNEVTAYKGDPFTSTSNTEPSPDSSLRPCEVDITFTTANNQVYELTCEGVGVLLNAKLNMILIAQAADVIGSVDICLEYNFPGGSGGGFWCGIYSVTDSAPE